MTGIETAAGGAVVKLVIERGGPAGLEFLSSLLKGKTLMVVGPPRSGKTTFLRYLEFGIFQHEQEIGRTYDPVESPRFNLKLGPNQNLKVSIKTAVDVPGQLAHPLANEVYTRRPHALLVILDATVPLNGDDESKASATWLTQFWSRLDQLWHSGKTSRNRLKTVIVVTNKMDREEERIVTGKENAFKTVTGQHFKAARGPDLKEIVFRRCIMVENPDGTRWVDAVLVDLATALTK